MAFPYANPGDAIELYLRVEKIQGFFNYDDAQHFQLLLRMQSMMGVKGDLMEIGAWKGRSSSFITFFMQPEEKLLIVDVFSNPAKDVYPDYPTVADVRENIARVNKNVDFSQLVFLESDGLNFELPDDIKLRFVHIDGGHSFDECYQDLMNITPRVISNGIVVIDDYDHPDWPAVKPATDMWLAENKKFRILGDLNRNVAKGKKIYLLKSEF